MAHGGKREGAGRKAGSASRKTREIANAAMAEGITPLEVMLQAMRGAWEAGNKAEAHEFAKDAAPYIHPRLAAVDHSGSMTVTTQEQALAEIEQATSQLQADGKPN